MLNAVEGGRFIDPIGGIIADSAEQVKPLMRRRPAAGCPGCADRQRSRSIPLAAFSGHNPPGSGRVRDDDKHARGSEFGSELAEGMRFELTVRLYTVQRFSKPPPSATRPPLRPEYPRTDPEAGHPDAAPHLLGGNTRTRRLCQGF